MIITKAAGLALFTFRALVSHIQSATLCCWVLRVLVNSFIRWFVVVHMRVCSLVNILCWFCLKRHKACQKVFFLKEKDKPESPDVFFSEEKNPNWGKEVVSSEVSFVCTSSVPNDIWWFITFDIWEDENPILLLFPAHLLNLNSWYCPTVFLLPLSETLSSPCSCLFNYSVHPTLNLSTSLSVSSWTFFLLGHIIL